MTLGAWRVYHCSENCDVRKKEFQSGDRVVYRKTKASVSPGPRAQNVSPSEHGDQYTYTVDKFWIVQQVLEDGALRLITRRGKEHIVQPTDPNLHRASWWERLWFRKRFDAIFETEEPGSPTAT
jgi:hypothetical protein